LRREGGKRGNPRSLLLEEDPRVNWEREWGAFSMERKAEARFPRDKLFLAEGEGVNVEGRASPFLKKARRASSSEKRHRLRGKEKMVKSISLQQSM